MKKFLIAAASLAALTVSASAADMAARPMYAKAAPPVVAPVFSWTGFYIGGNVGVLSARSAIGDLDSYAAAAPAGTVTTVNKTGFLGGGQIGYNWQSGQFVFGIELDGGWMDTAATTLLTGTASGTRVGLRSIAYGDITGRLGLAFDRALLYVKGGWAVSQDASAFSTVTGSFSGRTVASNNNGWTVGGGIEYMFADKWSVKGEYQYFDFRNTPNYVVLNAGGTPFRFNQNLNIHTGKIGINYHF